MRWWFASHVSARLHSPGARVSLYVAVMSVMGCAMWAAMVSDHCSRGKAQRLACGACAARPDRGFQMHHACHSQSPRFAPSSHCTSTAQSLDEGCPQAFCGTREGDRHCVHTHPWRARTTPPRSQDAKRASGAIACYRFTCKTTHPPQFILVVIL